MLPPRRSAGGGPATPPGWCSTPTRPWPSASSSASSSSCPREREDDLVGHLGPDLLGPDWDPTRRVRRLARAARPADRGRRCSTRPQPRRHRQHVRRRACFIAGVAPATPVASVPTSPGWCAGHQMLELNRAGPSRSRPATCARTQSWVMRPTGRRCGTPSQTCGPRAERRPRCPRCRSLASYTALTSPATARARAVRSHAAPGATVAARSCRRAPIRRTISATRGASARRSPARRCQR